MSLARTALRLAAIEALGADPTISALCRDPSGLLLIYDSRIDQMDSADPVPVMTVYTEDDGGAAVSANNGGPPFDQICEMLIEIAMKAVVPVDADTSQIGVATTDRNLEATLDLLEHRAVEAVTIASTFQRRVLTEHVTRRVRAYKSVRFASDETGIKLAVRMLHLTVQLKGDDHSDVSTGPFASLPNPLRAVAASLPSGSSGLATCEALAGAITVPDAAPMLLRAGFLSAPNKEAPLTTNFPLSSPST